MASHTVRGTELVSSLGTILRSAIPLIEHHHDHYSADSKQEGSHGEDIPIGARIVAVADAYDAIVTDRPYRLSVHLLTSLNRDDGIQCRDAEP